MAKSKNKEILDRCNKYLNDSINMVEPFEKLTEDFMFDITILDQKNAKDIVEEHSDYVMMLRSIYREYKDNVEDFERYVLRLNSVISSSLTIEYRVNDILYNKDYIMQIVDEIIERESKGLMDKVGESLKLEDLQAKMEEYIKTIKENTTKRTIQLLNHNNIEDMKKDYYFIGNISKDKDLKELIEQICKIYIENELIESVRTEIYRKHKIVIKNEKKNKIHCLKMGAYDITKEKIEKVISLSLQNYKQNIIDNRTLQLFKIFFSFEEMENDKQYQEIIKKNTLDSIEAIEENKEKYIILSSIIKDYTTSILKELGWC